MIYYKTLMDKIPNSCAECKCEWCSLPLMKNRYEPIIKKEYEQKRHSKCPLVLLEK